MHSYHGKNGVNIHFNGDFSGKCILNYEETDVELPCIDLIQFVLQYYVKDCIESLFENMNLFTMLEGLKNFKFNNKYN